jgi:hypothetical protein
VNALDELETLMEAFDRQNDRLPELITMSPRKWCDFMASLPHGVAMDVHAKAMFCGVRVVKGLAPGLTCRNCGAPFGFGTGEDSCSYCKTPKHVIELT